MRAALFAIAAALTGCVLDPPRPQPNERSWQDVSPEGSANQPGPMDGAKLTYDSIRKKVVMYTGKNVKTGDVPGMVYEWDGTEWTEICGGSPRPTPVFMPGFAFNPNDGQLVMTGGAYETPDLGFSALSSDTWTCDEEGVWTYQTSGSINSPRVGGELVYNEEARLLILLGGRNENGPVRISESSTDATSWDKHEFDLAMAGAGTNAIWDDDVHRIVMVAGFLSPPGQEPMFRDEIWTMPGTGFNITQLCHGCTGHEKSDVSIVHATGTNETYFFNGYVGEGQEVHDTWIIDQDETFAIIPDQLPDRDGVGVAWDANRDRAVAFGGVGTSCSSTDYICGQTWELH